MAQNSIFSRSHKIAQARFPQLRLNQLSIAGGRAYVRERLWRAPNESDASWTGSTKVLDDVRKNCGAVGRVDRAALVADAQRVARKLNDYIFAEDAKRDGASPEFLQDVDGFGSTARQFFDEVSLALTGGQWCWLQADRGRATLNPDGTPAIRTLAARMADKADRPRWTLWPSTSVPDWCFSADGSIAWLITEWMQYDNSNPMAVASDVKHRTLWIAGKDGQGATWHTYSEGAADPYDSGMLPTAEIPFVLVGTPTMSAWWMDNVESLQAQLLNLDSLHVENLVRAVYPQLVIPMSMLQNVEARLLEREGAEGGRRVVEVVREVVRGLDSPFVETPEDANITRFLTPSAADLAAIPYEITRKRGLLFENVGLSRFFSESKQIMSAEGQRLGLQDINAALKHRALELQDAENELVRATKLLDTAFASYTAEWNTVFDVHDAAEDARTLETLSKVLVDDAVGREMVMSAARRVAEQF